MVRPTLLSGLLTARQAQPLRDDGGYGCGTVTVTVCSRPMAISKGCQSLQGAWAFARDFTRTW